MSVVANRQTVGDGNPTNAVETDSTVGRRVVYQSSGIAGQNASRITEYADGRTQVEEVKPKKKKSWHENVMNRLATCIQPLTSGVGELPFPTPSNPTLRGTKPAPATVHVDVDSDDGEFFDAIDADDDEVNERTRPLHEALALSGRRPTLRSSAQWWDNKLLRSQGELYARDFLGSFTCRLDPLFADLMPRGAIIQVNKDRAGEVMNFESNAFRGRICFRSSTLVKEGAVPSDYFKGRKRLFSFQVQGRFKEEIEDIDDLKGVALFQKDISMPWFAPKVLKLIEAKDKNLLLKFDQSPPYVGGTQLKTCMRFAEDELVNGEIPEWQWGGDLVLLEHTAKDEKSSSKLADLRRGNFEAWQEQTGFKKFSTEKAYCFDLFNSYVDFATMSLTFGPFLTFGVGTFIQHQPITLRAYNTKTGNTCWGMQLVWKQGIDDKILD